MDTTTKFLGYKLMCVVILPRGYSDKWHTMESTQQFFYNHQHVKTKNSHEQRNSRRRENLRKREDKAIFKECKVRRRSSKFRVVWPRFQVYDSSRKELSLYLNRFSSQKFNALVSVFDRTLTKGNHQDISSAIWIETEHSIII